MQNFKFTVQVTSPTGRAGNADFFTLKSLKKFLYFVSENEYNSTILVEISNGKTKLHSIERKATKESADEIFIWAYYYYKFGYFKWEDSNSHAMVKLGNYIVKALRDAHEALNEVYLPGETVNYSLVIINKKVYLDFFCNTPEVRNKVYYRLSNNLHKGNSFKLKDKNDPLYLSPSDVSIFKLKEIPCKYGGNSYLYLNERRLRELIYADNFILATTFLDMGVKGQWSGKRN